MKIKESIHDMITHITNIVNELSSLGKTIPTEEQVQKVLRSLPSEDSMSKVTALQKTKDLKAYNLEELIGSLITFEVQLERIHRDTQSRKEKSITLKVDDEDLDLDDDGFAMVARRMRKMTTTKRAAPRKAIRVNLVMFLNLMKIALSVC